MKVLKLQPAKRVLWQVVDGPRNGSAASRLSRLPLLATNRRSEIGPSMSALPGYFRCQLVPLTCLAAACRVSWIPSAAAVRARDDFKQVTVRVFEVDTASAVMVIDIT